MFAFCYDIFLYYGKGSMQYAHVILTYDRLICT